MSAAFSKSDPPDFGDGVRCDDEIPLRPDLRLREAEPLLDQLGCSVAGSRVRGAIALLVANLVEAEQRAPGTWMFYSRDRNYYTARNLPRRYVPDFFRYNPMMAAVAWIERNGLIEHCRTKPSACSIHRSRMRATPKLLAACRDVEIVSRPKEVIILRDKDKRELAYNNSSDVDRMRRDVLEQNEVIETTDIRISDACDARDAHGRVYREIYGPRALRRRLRRIFNGGWTSGGRWYGPLWQSLPKDVRKHLLIDGEPGTEIDYRACHLRLLCALANIDLPFAEPGFDPYALPGLPREQVKRAFSILINASSARATVIALAQDLRVSSDYAKYLVGEVQQHLPGLQRAWRPSIGLHLQYRDAQICMRVQRALRRRGIAVLSVHDSFIVAQHHAGLLRQVMDYEMEVECRRLRRG